MHLLFDLVELDCADGLGARLTEPGLVLPAARRSLLWQGVMGLAVGAVHQTVELDERHVVVGCKGHIEDGIERYVEAGIEHFAVQCHHPGAVALEVG